MNFKCPKCGNPFFNTPDLSVKPWVRRCRGALVKIEGLYDYAGCDFEWPETDDDKYLMEKPEET